MHEVPAPVKGPASLLVANRFSLISAGTERAVMKLGQASLVGKARARPDLVSKVIDTAREEGIASAYRKVSGRLGEPGALGYSCAGVVVEACPDAPAAPGELVACAGAGLATHAELVAVPRTLCARVPEGVRPEDAAYATVATIALHGIRLASLGLGDVAAVVGLGLVGQLAIELLQAAGCVALGVDPDPGRVELARQLGMFATTDAAELESEICRLTAGRGADGVVVTAASRSSAPLATATAVARERAVVAIIGDVEIQSPRAPLFAKELRLVVSRSYGPGRYDPVYEERGIDYPAGYVRWTEGRNLEEVLRLMADGRLRPGRLTTHVFDLDQGPLAYERLQSGEPTLGILLRYPPSDGIERTVRVPVSARPRPRLAAGRQPRIGVIGAGAFARGVLLPHLARLGKIVAVATATGPSAVASAQRFSAPVATTDPLEILDRPDIDAIVIATRHDTHAALAAAALWRGKHVFVEKPLAISEPELQDVADAAAGAGGILMVGFNRRFAPLAQPLRERLGAYGPSMISIRVNAGRLPRSHWTHDPQVGGGRIVGEVCHFVDLAMFLTGSHPASAEASAIGGSSEPQEDSLSATLRMADGSLATIVYSALGDPRLPKERVEVLGGAGAGVLDDFAELALYLPEGQSSQRRRRDKGHRAELEAFVAGCRDGRQPWPVEDMVAAMRSTFAIRDAVEGTLTDPEPVPAA